MNIKQITAARLSAAAMLCFFVGCSKKPSDGEETSCVPSCTADRCGDDGCGGRCECPTGTECGEDGRCVDPDDCEKMGWECGSINGVSCGHCDPEYVCEQGACVCEPRCDGGHCGDDGCGGECLCGEGALCDDAGDCVSDTGCETCEERGWECGEACGERCGICEPYESCAEGRCACEPDCDGTHCRGDGCGDICECLDGDVCDSAGGCVDVTSCPDTCEGSGAECGEICGESCGACQGDDVCVDGVCVCEARCDGVHCGDDGCGGTCGCPGAYVCGEDGLCTEPVVCEETCGTLGYECGEVCGESCGGCREDELCSLGMCICTPVCDKSRCGANNCGGSCACGAGEACDASFACVPEAACRDTCETAGAECGTICGHSCGACEEPSGCIEGRCVETESCAECPLVLTLKEIALEDGALERVVIAVHYNPRAGDPRARMMELFIGTSPPMVLRSLEEGPALDEAGKSLATNGDTGNPWTELARGEYRLVALSAGNTSDFAVGVMMTLTFTTPASLLGTAVSFSILRKSQLAPESADMLLQLSPYDTPVRAIVE